MAIYVIQETGRRTRTYNDSWYRSGDYSVYPTTREYTCLSDMHPYHQQVFRDMIREGHRTRNIGTTHWQLRI